MTNVTIESVFDVCLAQEMSNDILSFYLVCLLLLSLHTVDYWFYTCACYPNRHTHCTLP